MFDFEKLQVYLKAREFNSEIKNEILSLSTIDNASKFQLRRAAMSIMLNIAEGTSRFSRPEKRHYFVIARGSVFECVAINDILASEKIISDDVKCKYYAKAEEISKMLFAMIKFLENKKPV